MWMVNDVRKGAMMRFTAGRGLKVVGPIVECDEIQNWRATETGVKDETKFGLPFYSG